MDNVFKRRLAWSPLLLGWLCLSCSLVFGHDWHAHDKLPVHDDHHHASSTDRDLASSATRLVVLQASGPDDEDPPAIVEHFQAFEKLKLRWDDDYLYVESDGLPSHNMMVGIRSWQQQVPLPQPFTGRNAWRIPLHPKLALHPISAKTKLFRGAIALAVNGVPIFNALNNRGEDAFLAGELDQWGGHCGRGDDYHYHVAPIHLQKIVGEGNPIAYALDGFPIYGLTNADGSAVGKLDELNGQFDADGRYHYHATKTYPYINGGMRGVVTVRGDQIDPQPRDQPLRPAQRPLRGATITSFKVQGDQSILQYRLGGGTGKVTYRPVGSNAYRFTYTEPSGRSRTETYERRPRRR